MDYRICDNADYENGSEVLLEEVKKFHEILFGQALVGAGIQLGLLKLFRITFPTFKVMDNRVSFFFVTISNYFKF